MINICEIKYASTYAFHVSSEDTAVVIKVCNCFNFNKKRVLNTHLPFDRFMQQFSSLLQKIDDFYAEAKHAMRKALSPPVIMSYRPERNRDLSLSLTAVSSDTSSKTASKQLSNLMIGLTETTKQEKKAKERREYEKRMKELDAMYKMDYMSDISSITSLSTSVGREGVKHIVVPPEEPPADWKTKEEPIKECREAIPALLDSMNPKDEGQLKSNMECLENIINGIMDGLEDDTQRKNERSSKRSSCKKRIDNTSSKEAHGGESKRISRTRPSMSRTRSMRIGMQLSVSQPGQRSTSPKSEANEEAKDAKSHQKPAKVKVTNVKENAKSSSSKENSFRGRKKAGLSQNLR